MTTFVRAFKITSFLFFICTSAIAQKKKEIAQITTPQGKIWVWLYDETPAHKASFIQLANDGYWDSLTFNRVVPDFVIQGGCPDTEEGFTDSAYLLKPEFVPSLRHEYGTFAAGRDNNPENLSARCQFYIVQNKNGLTRLDNNYTVYGKVIRGMDVVNKIAHVPRDAKDEPVTPVTLKIRIVKVNSKKVDRLRGKPTES